MTTFIRTQCSVKLRGRLESRWYQETHSEYKFNLIEAKYQGMNEQLNFGIYIRDLDKYKVEVLTMQERILFAAKF
jgi:hypothetical protein